MNKQATLFLVLLAFAFNAAQAVTVSQSQAVRAAATWAISGDALGARLGATVKTAQVRTVSVADDVVFHIVPFEEGGVVFTSGDTDCEPIIAFTANDDVDLSDTSPLIDLLKKDALLRSRMVASRSTSTSSSGNSAAHPETKESQAKWSVLLSGDGAIASDATANSSVAAVKPVDSVSDIRVKPIIKSKWSQSSAGGGYCYNFYTPNHTPCGCTATAAAQVMRYFSYPTAEMPSGTFSCKVDNAAKSLSTIGGVYDWQNMALAISLGEYVSEKEREAIGHLTYDIGVALCSEYTAKGTSAKPYDVAKMMRNNFSYANAFTFWDNSSYSNGKGGLHNLSLRKLVIYSNLDAKIPVQLAIYGYDHGHFGDSNYWAGHAVVADGYGFKTIDGSETAFVHINMGWGGSDDMWYNIPDINTSETGATIDSSATDYCYLGGATFNVFTEETGLEVLSGRVTDHDGNPIAGVKITLKGEDSQYETTTDDYGIYAFTVEGAKSYVVRAEADGLIAESDAIYLAKTRGSEEFVIATSSSVGNSWGNDMVLAPPAAKVGEDVYPTLDKAVAAAKVLSKPENVPVVWLLENIKQDKPISIDFSCLIASSSDDPADTKIERAKNAVIKVEQGGSLVLSNVVFETSSSTVVEVAVSGKFTLVGNVDFCIDGAVAAVKTADAEGLEIVGSLSKGFALDCAAAKNLGQAFGTIIAPSVEDAAKTAALIANFNDDSGDIRGAAEGEASPYVLKWAEVPVPFEECSCYYVDEAGNTNTSARLERIFVRFASALAAGEIQPGAEIVVRKSGSLVTPITVSENQEMSVVGENGAVVDASAFAGFVVDNGGKLTVQGLGFKDYKGNALFYVNGGELVLSNGVSIVGAVGTNYHSGAVAVMGGTATLGPEITIKDCSFAVYGSGNGAGVYVNANATLNFLGGTITGCLASGNGGAIYVNRNGKLNLQGEMNVFGNRKYSISTGNDIYLPYSSSELTIMGPVSGKVGILYGTTAGTFNKVGGAFAKIASGLSDKDIAGIARNSASFVCDSNLDLRAAFSDDQKSLVWSENAADAGTVPENLIDYAYARVVEPGLASVYYWSVADAFAAVKVDGTLVEMLKSDSLSGAVAVTNNNVTLAGVLVDGLKSGLSGGTLEVSGSLALTNLVMSGENLLKVDGGMLYVDDAIESPIGCVGGTKDEPMLFAEVRASLAYDSLTNSAANFRNSELDAYGVAVTNESRTLVVWSRAIAADGTFTGVDGTVWGCVGEVPVYEIEVRPDPIAFKEISRDETDGSWNLTLTNLVKGCWYSLYSTNSLAGGFLVGEGVSEPVTNFQAEADGEFIFKAEGVGEATFWKVVAEPGTISE